MKGKSEYLEDLPSLSGELLEHVHRRRHLTPDEEQQADAVIAEAKDLIRISREVHEMRTGETVFVEPPTQPTPE
jgi:hypothetical protein